MSQKRKLLSLCIPTNGISEWVFPVLDSIYNQEVPEGEYEVIVTDNGTNNDFRDKMLAYAKKHSNLTYKKTTSYMFDNQLDALREAHGEYLKFINHRLVLDNGSLRNMIDFLENYLEEKPVIYFSNGVLDLKEGICTYDSFDLFVRALRRYASWTTGVGIWKDQFDKIPANQKFDKISPHSEILFSERKAQKYIINDHPFGHDIETDSSKKGRYDLFKAFGVEEFTITLKLFIDGDITAKTLKIVKKDYYKFLCSLYENFVIRKKPCSYNLSGFDDAMGIYFNKQSVQLGAWFVLFQKGFHKLFALISSRKGK